MVSVAQLSVKLFADGAEVESIRTLYANPLIKGFTTNPTLMRKAGVVDYKRFAHEVLAVVPDRPISFEVFADDHATMLQQAREIASWGPNVFVKIPVTNTQGESSSPVIQELAGAGVKVNVTAVMTTAQVSEVASVLVAGVPANVSIFAGRIADTGRDPVPLVTEAVRMLERLPDAELIWASPRELLNVFQADEVGCHIITATPDILNKLALVGKDLNDYSLDTVKMFFEDGRRAGYQLAGLNQSR